MINSIAFMKRSMSPALMLVMCVWLAVSTGCGGSPPSNKPDLVVQLMDNVGPSIPNPPLIDRPASFDALVVNTGTQPVKQSFKIVLELDGKKVQTWTFPSKAEQQDAKPGQPILLKPGSSRLYTYVLQTISKGKHTLRWIADTENTVDEQHEGATSNELTLAVNAQLPPDLVVDIEPSEIPKIGSGPVTEQPTEWKVIVTNNGFGRAYGPFVTQFSSSPFSQLVAPLEFPKGQYLESKASHTFKVKQLYTQPGSVKVSATVDQQGNVTESLYGGEANNGVQKTYPLKSVDIDVYALDVLPNDPTTADKIDLKFTVRNKGGMNAIKPFNVGIQVIDQPPAGYGVSRVRTANPLDAGFSVQMSEPITLPKPGLYKIVVSADASIIGPKVTGEQYFEADEQNNVFSKMLTVKPEPVTPVPVQCTPGKGTLSLLKKTDNCPTGLVHGYSGIIKKVKAGVLKKITNTSKVWRIKIIQQFNTQGQLGTMACENHGGLCHNVKKTLAVLEPGQSWSKIPNPDLSSGYSINVCLEPASFSAPKNFPSKVDIAYEWTCK
ncbi:MAG: CARDB domain-containing protein [Desulfobacteraceae bacterium]